MISLDQPPPSNTAAEKSLLGSVLISGTPHATFDQVSECVRPADFYDDANRLIFEHMASLRRLGKPIDHVLLVDSMKHATAHDVAAFDNVGGVDYLANVLKTVPHASHAAYYASIVRETSDKRRLLDVAITTARASNNGSPAADIVATLRSAVTDFERRDTSTRYRRLTAAELDDAQIDVEYLVDGVLAAKHVGGIIGASKSLKTTIAADLAFSVATGGRFLGYFDVLRSARTAFMSGESGLPTLQETLRRIARAAGRELRDAADLLISDELPQLGSEDHMAALRRFIEQDAIELLIIDPLYLCADTEGREGSLFAMGALLRSVAEVATDCGTTLLILHHMTQGSAKTCADRNPELFDSAWAGTQQFFRQWIAINRRTPYDPEQAGHHELRLVTGGSMGHASGIALDIDEGNRTDLGGRRWEVTVRSLSEVKVEQLVTADSIREQQREAKKEAKFEGDCELVLRKLDAIYPEGTTARDLRTRCKFSGDRVARVIADLEESEAIETCEVTVSNHKKPRQGYRIRKDPKDLLIPE